MHFSRKYTPGQFLNNHFYVTIPSFFDTCKAKHFFVFPSFFFDILSICLLFLLFFFFDFGFNLVWYSVERHSRWTWIPFLSSTLFLSLSLSFSLRLLLSYHIKYISARHSKTSHHLAEQLSKLRHIAVLWIIELDLRPISQTMLWAFSSFADEVFCYRLTLRRFSWYVGIVRCFQKSLSLQRRRTCITSTFIPYSLTNRGYDPARRYMALLFSDSLWAVD